MGKRIIRCEKLFDEKKNPTIHEDECLVKKGEFKPNNQSCLKCNYYKVVISPSRHKSQRTSTKLSIKQTKEAQEEKQLDRAEPKTFSRRQFIRLKRIKADPEFISIMGQIGNLNKRINDIGEKYNKLPPASNEKNTLWSKLSTLNDQLESIYDTLVKKYGLTIPELADEDIKEKHFRQFDPFYDGEVIQVIPYKSAKVIPNPENPDRPILDADPIYDLWLDSITQEPRYLQVRIDTWQPAKIIIATLRNILAPFRVNTRFRETEITLPVLEKKAQGKTDAEITREMYRVNGQPAYDEEADRCRKRVSRAHKKIKAKKQ